MPVRDFHLPDLGEGLTEAELLAWLVGVGDEIVVDQHIAEVETAKAAVELPSPFAGVVVALQAAVGDNVSVGDVLISIDDGQSASGLTEPGVEVPEASGNVLVGYGTANTEPRRGRRNPTTPSPTQTSGRQVAFVSPLVRRLATSKGLDVTQLTGTGPSGLIMRKDVETACCDLSSQETPNGPSRLALNGLRRAAVANLSRSRREIPEATVWVDADISRTVELRTHLRESGQPIGMLALLCRFVVAALKRFPELNSRFDSQTSEVLLFPLINLGLAMQTPRGLVVPVVHDAQHLGADRLHQRITDLTQAAREGHLRPVDVQQGTFTVNNYGVFGVDGSAAIINFPEAAILGMGRVMQRPWVVGGAVIPRWVVELTLTFDHRVCDGGTAGGFLRFLADCLERPDTMLAFV